MLACWNSVRPLQEKSIALFTEYGRTMEGEFAIWEFRTEISVQTEIIIFKISFWNYALPVFRLLCKTRA